jgi:hypothetical protein
MGISELHPHFVIVQRALNHMPRNILVEFFLLTINTNQMKRNKETFLINLKKKKVGFKSFY